MIGFKNRRSMQPGMSMLVLALIAMALTACDLGVAPATPVRPLMQGTATLRHGPVGSAELSWDTIKQTLTVKVAMNEFAPKSLHLATIYMGNCTITGQLIYELQPIVADKYGVAVVTTTIKGVTNGIPGNEWSLAVQNGDDRLVEAEQQIIACGTIANPDSSTHNKQFVRTFISDVAMPNQAANGLAQFSITNHQLTIHITMSGLTVNSRHMAYLHRGSCTTQGTIIFPLQPIIVDANGNGSSTTTVNKAVALPAHGWYIAIHLAQNWTEMRTTSGSDPIACGNLAVPDAVTG